MSGHEIPCSCTQAAPRPPAPAPAEQQPQQQPQPQPQPQNHAAQPEQPANGMRGAVPVPTSPGHQQAPQTSAPPAAGPQGASGFAAVKGLAGSTDPSWPASILLARKTIYQAVLRRHQLYSIEATAMQSCAPSWTTSRTCSSIVLNQNLSVPTSHYGWCIACVQNLTAGVTAESTTASAHVSQHAQARRGRPQRASPAPPWTAPRRRLDRQSSRRPRRTTWPQLQAAAARTSAASWTACRRGFQSGPAHAVPYYSSQPQPCPALLICTDCSTCMCAHRCFVQHMGALCTAVEHATTSRPVMHHHRKFDGMQATAPVAGALPHASPALHLQLLSACSLCALVKHLCPEQVSCIRPAL